MTNSDTITENGRAHKLGALPKEKVSGLSGMDTFNLMRAGKLPAPPLLVHSNIRLKEYEEGRTVFTGLPEKEFLNPFGTVHGGWISTLIDSALSCAVHTTLKPGEMFATTSLTVNLVRPLKAGSGEVSCEGTVVHRGSRLATAEGGLTSKEGKLIAHGTVTCMIMPIG